jgi:hypothetical protein
MQDHYVAYSNKIIAVIIYIFRGFFYVALTFKINYTHLYNNQLDALFTITFLNYHTSTCFGVSTAYHQERESIYIFITAVILHAWYDITNTVTQI